MKKMRLTIGDYVVYASLHDDKIPKTIAAIEEYLPASGCIRHAKICDNEWMLPMPFAIDVDEPNNKIRPVPGDIGYNRLGQFFCGWYDNMVPLGYTNLVATVDPEYLDGYRQHMHDIWAHPGALVKVEFVEV